MLCLRHVRDKDRWDAIPFQKRAAILPIFRLCETSCETSLTIFERGQYPKPVRCHRP